MTGPFRTPDSLDRIEAAARRLEGLRGAGGRMPTRRQLIAEERAANPPQGLRSPGGRGPAPRQRLRGTNPEGQGQKCGDSTIPAWKECRKARGPNQLAAMLRKRFPGLKLQLEEQGNQLLVRELAASGAAPGLMQGLRRFARDRGLALVLPSGGRGDSLLARLDALQARLDAGRGVPCGKGWISPDKDCHKGQQAAPAAPAGRVVFSQTPEGEMLLNGQKRQGVLGSGAFGSVYPFQLPGVGKVALKIAKTEQDPNDSRFVEDWDRLAWARREADTMAKAAALGHAPEVLMRPVLVASTGDRYFAFAYGMAAGKPLNNSAARRNWSPEDHDAFQRNARKAARDLADAGLVHDDLHGGNVIAGPGGAVKFVDWAYSRDTSDRPRSAADRASDELHMLRWLDGDTRPDRLKEQGPGAFLSPPGAGYDPERRLFTMLEKAGWPGKLWEAQRAQDQLRSAIRREIADAGPSPFEVMRRRAELRAQGWSEEDIKIEATLVERDLNTEERKRIAAAGDAVFSEQDLRDMRQAIDDHAARYAGQFGRTKARPARRDAADDLPGEDWRQLLHRAHQAAARGEEQEYQHLRRRAQQAYSGAPSPAVVLLARVDAIAARLDARRKPGAAPGQLGLFSGGGEGTGVPCGESHISRDKECRKGQGAAAASASTPKPDPAPAQKTGGDAPAATRLADPRQGSSITRQIHAGRGVLYEPERIDRWLEALEQRPGEAGANARAVRQIHLLANLQTIVLRPGQTLMDQPLDGLDDLQQRLHRSYKGKMGADTPGRWLANYRAGFVNRRSHPDIVKKLDIVMGMDWGSAGLCHRGIPLIKVNGSMSLKTRFAASLQRDRDPTPASLGKFRAMVAAGVLGTYGADPAALDRYKEARGAEFTGPEKTLIPRTLPGVITDMGVENLEDFSGGFADNLATWIHETGHAVRNINGDDFRDDPPRSAPYAPSKYGRFNREESFAEWMVGYVVAPEAVRAVSPEVYDWVDLAVKRAVRWAPIAYPLEHSLLPRPKP